MADTDTAETIVSDSVCEPTQSATPVRSGVNTSYRVRTTETSYFIKFGTDNNSETILTEAAILRRLDGVIPTPHIHDAGTVESTSYFISSWIDGTQPNYELTESDAWLAKELGRNLAVLHTELGFQPGHPQSKTGTDLRIDTEDWTRLFKDWLVTHAEDAKKNYPGIGSELIRLIHWSDMPTLTGDAVLTPLDYHGGNALTTNNHVAAFIDFERCYSGHPGWSYTTSKRLLSSHPALADAFETGYATIRETPDAHPTFKIAAMVRELRMAHMLFDDPSTRAAQYRQELETIEHHIG